MRANFFIWINQENLSCYIFPTVILMRSPMPMV